MPYSQDALEIKNREGTQVMQPLISETTEKTFATIREAREYQIEDMFETIFDQEPSAQGENIVHALRILTLTINRNLMDLTTQLTSIEQTIRLKETK